MKKNVFFAILMSLTTAFAATSAFASGYAAIVFNTKTGAWAAARGADNRELAETTAIQYCADCKIGGRNITVAELQENSRVKKGEIRETYVHNGWIALAFGKGNTHWGTAGDHASRATSEASAIKNCGGAANNCEVVRSLSSYDGGGDEDGVVPPAPAATPAQ